MDMHVIPNSIRVALAAGAISGILAAPTQVAAQAVEPMITDRPDFTESASTVSPGRFQFELGYTFARSGEENRHSFGELLVRLGLVSWMEARLELNSFSVNRAPGAEREGFEDLALSLKAVLFRKPEESSAAVPQVALLVGADLPTGDSDFGATEVQPIVKAILSWELTARLVVASNIGWALLKPDGERFDQGLGSLVLAYSISEPITVFGEWYGFFPENRGGGSNHYLNAGLGWLLSPDVQLDWRIGVGLQDPDPNWFTGAGVSFRL